MKEFFYHYERCASYSRTLHCPGLLLPGTRDTHPRFRDSPGHSGTVGHPTSREERKERKGRKKGEQAGHTRNKFLVTPFNGFGFNPATIRSHLTLVMVSQSRAYNSCQLMKKFPSIFKQINLRSYQQLSSFFVTD